MIINDIIVFIYWQIKRRGLSNWHPAPFKLWTSFI